MTTFPETSDAAARLFGRPWPELEAVAAETVATACGRVVRVAYASRNTQWEDPRPAWSERLGLRPATKASANRPTALEASVEYGYDGDDVLITARRFYDDERVESECIWVATQDGRPVQLLFDSDLMGNRRLTRLIEVDGDREHLVAVAVHYAPDDRLARPERERYVYDDRGRVETITYVRSGSGGPETTRHHLRYVGDSSEIASVRASYDGGEEEFVYRRATPKEVKQAMSAAEAALASMIDAAVGESAGPLMRVGLRYSYEDPWALLSGIGVDSGQGGWDPAEFSRYVDDPQIPDAARLTLEQEWRTINDPDARRRFLVRCAKAATKALGERHPGSAFAVYPYDDEQAEFATNVRQSVSKELRKSLGLQ